MRLCALGDGCDSLFVNVLIGVVSGLGPLLDETGAIVQAAIVMSLQLGMALICYWFRPDADKIFSIFAGTQFLVEACATACVLMDALDARSGVGGGVGTRAEASFYLAIAAIFIPMTQLVEHRLITPMLGGARKHNCDPVKIASVLWLLLVSLPALMTRLCRTMGGNGAAQAENTSMSGEDLQVAVGKATAKYAATGATGAASRRVDTTRRPNEQHDQHADGDDDGGG